MKENAVAKAIRTIGACIIVIGIVGAFCCGGVFPSIAKLEGEKAVFAAQKEFATAQLELAKAAINGESEMTSEFATYKINLGITNIPRERFHW